eukprot:4441169-Prorocentrum_lima.AAC.1
MYTGLEEDCYGYPSWDRLCGPRHAPTLGDCVPVIHRAECSHCWNEGAKAEKWQRATASSG